MANKFFSIIACLFFSIVTYSQPRVDGNLQFKVLKTSPLITNIVGWAYDKGKGKWAGYYNTIWEVYKGNNKTPIKTTAHNMSFNENVVSLQVKKISYKDKIYYALIKIYWTGGYTYPSIMEDWYKLQQRDIYIYEPEEYEKFFSLDTNITNIKTYDKLLGYSPQEWTINNMLRQLLNGEELKRNKYPHELNIKKEDDNTYRFLWNFSDVKKEEAFTQKYFEIKKSVLMTLLIK